MELNEALKIKSVLKHIVIMDTILNFCRNFEGQYRFDSHRFPGGEQHLWISNNTSETKNIYEVKQAFKLNFNLKLMEITESQPTSVSNTTTF